MIQGHTEIIISYRKRFVQSGLNRAEVTADRCLESTQTTRTNKTTKDAVTPPMTHIRFRHQLHSPRPRDATRGQASGDIIGARDASPRFQVRAPYSAPQSWEVSSVSPVGARPPEGQAAARHVPRTIECVAVSCAALPPRLGESTSAALTWAHDPNRSQKAGNALKILAAFNYVSTWTAGRNC